MQQSQLIQPRLLKGFQDFLPEKMISRQKVIQKIRNVYERYGFLPLDTPAQEYTLTLLGQYSEEGNKQIYRLQSPEAEDVALRFDLTVPLARVVALYNELPKPFRRYQIGTVWRADKPDPGRFREFTQFDMDAVGCPDIYADVEILLAMFDTLTELEINNFKIYVNDRKLLNGLIAYAQIEPNKAIKVFRVLDKLDKIGMGNVEKELGAGRVDDSGDCIAGVNLQNEQISKILKFVDIPKNNRNETINLIKNILKDIKEAEAGITELETISEALNAVNIPDDKIIIDPSLARGLDYYTGPVFEAKILDALKFGTVFAGGRYDNLLHRFTGEDIPSTGASIGVDRLISALEFLNKISDDVATAKVLVTQMDKKHKNDYLKFARMLREAGINAELYTGKETGLGKQLQYANIHKMWIAIIAGENEFKENSVSIKNLREGLTERKDSESRDVWLQKSKSGQITIPLKDMVETVKKILTN